jgi:hypothetical protein
MNGSKGAQPSSSRRSEISEKGEQLVVNDVKFCQAIIHTLFYFLFQSLFTYVYTMVEKLLDPTYRKNKILS